ncbi:MAG: hypothetical protein NVS4B7_18930 [Ktedonobacteraceae bacterium]
MVLLSACVSSQQDAQRLVPAQPIVSNSVHVQSKPDPSAPILIARQIVTPTPTATPPPTVAPTISAVAPPTNIPGSGSGPAPYGQPPAMSALEVQLTQQLFALINHDRAVRGLYPFIWNNTLAGGARLHSWNMIHCGFSHTCPDGLDQCTHIANEGFAGFTDCGENIGLAGPSAPPTPWSHIYSVQESMMAEGPTGWHFIHLTSTTLHSIGVGLVVDANGWAWFTEDMVSQG